jgi:hypothetical protein
MEAYSWMGKQVTKEQIQEWIDWKKGEMKAEEKLRGRGTNNYQGWSQAVREAELLISDQCTDTSFECHARNGLKCMNGVTC